MFADLLETAMFYNLSENDFYSMTIGEITRYIAVQKKKEQYNLRLQAQLDYIHADLIGRSVGRIYSSSAKLPELYEAYPNLFEQEVIEDAKQQRKDEISASNFIKFANSFNKRFKGGK